MEDALSPAIKPVVIIGAGATGSTAALLLARQGIPSVVLDRRTSPLGHPAAHVLNATSFEIWDAASPLLAQQIAELAPPVESVRTIQWATRPGGRPLGEIDLLEADDRDQVESFSSYLRSHVGEHQLMPELWHALEREPLVTVRNGCVVQEISEVSDEVRVLIISETGSSETIEADYVIAADGANSTVRDRLNISMEGAVLAHMGSVFFHSEMLHPAGTSRPLLTWIYRPDFCGVLISHADDHYVLMTAYLHPEQEIARASTTYWQRILTDSFGANDASIRSTGTWTMSSQLADRFRSGHVFLAGDAAHRFPHTGGFGLNSGVQDADNLAWKLAAVVRGDADERLLDTYEIERRPVIEQFASYSLTNHFLLDEVTAPLGLTNRALCAATNAIGRSPFRLVPGPLMAWVAERATRLQTRRTAALVDDSTRGRKLRRHMSDSIPGQLQHFVSTGLEFGYIYEGPLIAVETGAVQREGDGILRHRPTTYPGARLPHALISRDGDDVPIRRMIQPHGLTLLSADPSMWKAALPQQAGPASLAVTVEALIPVPPMTPEGLGDLFEIGANGAVLVRPDLHVVWRTALPATEAAGDLDSFLHEHWYGYIPSGNPGLLHA